jgi:hypothetical protein
MARAGLLIVKFDAVTARLAAQSRCGGASRDSLLQPLARLHAYVGIGRTGAAAWKNVSMSRSATGPPMVMNRRQDEDDHWDGQQHGRLIGALLKAD